MPDKTWKSVERRVAAFLGGHRTGCTGQATPDIVDVPFLAIDVDE